MSNFKIKIDTKKFEKQLNKQIEEIAFEKQKEIIKKQLIKGDNEMNILPNKEEILLEIILNKYDGNENMIVNGSYDEIPSNIEFHSELNNNWSKSMSNNASNTSFRMQELKAGEIGKISAYLGAGRVKKDDCIDKTVGIELYKKIGDKV